MRGLLGLADRDRIFDLLETIFSGNAGKALTDLDALNRDGAEPAQVIADLADAVHAITRIKAAGESAADAPRERGGADARHGARRAAVDAGARPRLADAAEGL